MDLGLTGARAIVTGGSSGIGLAVARRLVAEGARVALVARDRSKLEAAAAAIRRESPEAEVVLAPADTTDDTSVRAIVDRVAATWSGVDEWSPAEWCTTRSR